METATERAFLVFPDGRVEEIDEEGGTAREWKAEGLHAHLREAGYPQFHEQGGYLDGGFDITVDGTRVTAHNFGPGAESKDMGAAGELFLAWMRENI